MEIKELAIKRSLPDRLFSIAVLLPFAAAIVYLHYGKDVPFDVFIYGSGSWGFGCILKLALYQGIFRRLPHDPSHIRRVSALNGLVSGATELGLALVVFTFMPALSLWDVVGFGVGIGTIEAFLVATTANPLPFVIAMAAFFVADGIIGYRLIHQGRLTELRVLNLTYGALAVIALVATACFLLYWGHG